MARREPWESTNWLKSREWILVHPPRLPVHYPPPPSRPLKLSLKNRLSRPLLTTKASWSVPFLGLVSHTGIYLHVSSSPLQAHTPHCIHIISKKRELKKEKYKVYRLEQRPKQELEQRLEQQEGARAESQYDQVSSHLFSSFPIIFKLSSSNVTQGSASCCLARLKHPPTSTLFVLHILSPYSHRDGYRS